MQKFPCPQCGARRGRPCVTVAKPHRRGATPTPGRPTYPHRERRKALLDEISRRPLPADVDESAAQ